MLPNFSSAIITRECGHFSVLQFADVENVAIMSANKPSETERLLQRILAKTPTPSQTRRITGFLARPWAIFVEITGVLVALVVFFEVYLQTIPEIDANNSEPSSILPFSIKNESNFFDMTEVHLSCGIDSAAYEIGNGKWTGMPGPTLFGPTQTVPVIRRHGGIVAYPCKASDYIHRNIWDDLCIGMKSACQNAIGSFKTSYMCVWIKVDYRTLFGWWPRVASSEIFSWNGREWIKGQIAASRSKDFMCGIVSDFQ
jgi:hypothetical protein